MCIVPLLGDDERTNTILIQTAFNGNSYPGILFGTDHVGLRHPSTLDATCSSSSDNNWLVEATKLNWKTISENVNGHFIHELDNFFQFGNYLISTARYSKSPNAFSVSTAHNFRTVCALKVLLFYPIFYCHSVICFPVGLLLETRPVHEQIDKQKSLVNKILPLLTNSDSDDKRMRLKVTWNLHTVASKFSTHFKFLSIQTCD